MVLALGISDKEGGEAGIEEYKKGEEVVEEGLFVKGRGREEGAPLHCLHYSEGDED